MGGFDEQNSEAARVAPTVWRPHQSNHPPPAQCGVPHRFAVAAERRCSGRKVACPGTVVRGSVRLIAAAATRSRTVEAGDLVPSELSSWRDLRGRLQRRQAVRTLGRRFRQDPAACLKSLEDSLINQALPS